MTAEKLSSRWIFGIVIGAEEPISDRLTGVERTRRDALRHQRTLRLGTGVFGILVHLYSRWLQRSEHCTEGRAVQQHS